MLTHSGQGFHSKYQSDESVRHCTLQPHLCH
jgi:hypothetical protein